MVKRQAPVNPIKLKTENVYFNDAEKYTFTNTSVCESKESLFMDSYFTVLVNHSLIN